MRSFILLTSLFIICCIDPTLSQSEDDDQEFREDKDALEPEPISSVLYSKKYKSVCQIKEKWDKARKLVDYYDKEFLNRFDKKVVEKSKQCGKNRKLDSLTKELVKNVCDPKADQKKIAKEVTTNICGLVDKYAIPWSNGFMFSANVAKPVFWSSPDEQFDKKTEEEPISAILYSEEYKPVCEIQRKWFESGDLFNYYNKEFLNRFDKKNVEKSKQCLKNGKLDSMTKELVKSVCDPKSDPSKIAKKVVKSICDLATKYSEAWRNGYMYSANLAKPAFF